MNADISRNITTTATALTALSAAAQDEPPGKRPEELLAKLRSTNELVSAEACEQAAEYGATAVRPLAFNLATADFELARKAKRALCKIVHHAGRPGAANEAAAVEQKLVGVLHSRSPLPQPVRREVLWLLSEIGLARTVRPVAELLTDKDLREDARCVLIRMPFPEAVAALKTALANAPEEFKPALADALRARGEKVEGYPSQKMVPRAQTSVVPIQPKK